MASNMDLDDGGEQVGPNAVEVVLDNSPDTSRKGKRKMIDRGDDTNNPAGEGGFKKKRITKKIQTLNIYVRGDLPKHEQRSYKQL